MRPGSPRRAGKYKGKHWKPELHRDEEPAAATTKATTEIRGSWGWQDDDGWCYEEPAAATTKATTEIQGSWGWQDDGDGWWYEEPAAAKTKATAVWSAATPGTGASFPRPADGGGGAASSAATTSFNAAGAASSAGTDIFMGSFGVAGRRLARPSLGEERVAVAG
jgi:hypothetical protein